MSFNLQLHRIINHRVCEWVLILWSSPEPTQLWATSRLSDVITGVIPSHCSKTSKAPPERLHRQRLFVALPPHLQNLLGGLPQPPLCRLLLPLLLLALAGLSAGGTRVLVVVGRHLVKHLQTHLSLGLSEEAAESLVPQGPVGELGPLPGLWFLQSQLELPQSVQLLHQLPLTCPAGLEIQLQVQGGTGRLLSQGGTVRLLLAHKYITNWIFTTSRNKCETKYKTEPVYISTFFFPKCS